MKKTSLIARYLLALVLAIFGLNKFLHFMPMPSYADGSAALNYMIGLSGTPLFPILGVLYLVSAALFVSNKCVGLAIVLIGAIAFNFTLFHLALDPANIVAALVVDVLLVIVAIGNAGKLKSLVP